MIDGEVLGGPGAHESDGRIVVGGEGHDVVDDVYSEHLPIDDGEAEGGARRHVCPAGVYGVLTQRLSDACHLQADLKVHLSARAEGNSVVTGLEARPPEFAANCEHEVLVPDADGALLHTVISLCDGRHGRSIFPNAGCSLRFVLKVRRAGARR